MPQGERDAPLAASAWDGVAAPASMVGSPAAPNFVTAATALELVTDLVRAET